MRWSSKSGGGAEAPLRYCTCGGVLGGLGGLRASGMKLPGAPGLPQCAVVFSESSFKVSWTIAQVGSDAATWSIWAAAFRGAPRRCSRIFPEREVGLVHEVEVREPLCTLRCELHGEKGELSSVKWNSYLEYRGPRGALSPVP